MKLIDPKLIAFVAVAQHKTVHQAALALFLTQTAVTSRIKLLEEKLGVALFVRSRRGMELTGEGQALLRYCHSFRSLEQDVLREIKGQGSDVSLELHIAGPTSIMCARIIPACTRLLAQYPLCQSYRIGFVYDCPRLGLKCSYDRIYGAFHAAA